MGKAQYQKWLTEEGQAILEKWARSGLTDKQIAKKMDIGLRTLYNYKSKFPEIAEALKVGKDESDAVIEKTLYLKAKSGDLGAIKMWLYNRRPEEWRETQHVTHKGNLDHIQIIDNISSKLEEE